MDLGVHLIDLASWTLEAPVTRVPRGRKEELADAVWDMVADRLS